MPWWAHNHSKGFSESIVGTLFHCETKKEVKGKDLVILDKPPTFFKTSFAKHTGGKLAMWQTNSPFLSSSSLN